MGTGGSVGCPALSPPPPPRSLFGSLQEEAVQDAESVRLQQQAHQQHSCTLDECFQLYTKEEQVGGTPKTAREHHGAGGRLLGLPRARFGVPTARGVPSWPRTTRGAARTAECRSRAR